MGQRGHPPDLVRGRDDLGHDPLRLQGLLHQPVEVRGHDHPDEASGDEPGDRLVGLGRQLLPHSRSSSVGTKYGSRSWRRLPVPGAGPSSSSE